MSSSLSNCLGLSTSFAATADEVTHTIPSKQGIMTALASQDADRTKAASLRRTLSADMSCKTWSLDTGFKRITSSGQFPDVNSSDQVDGKEDEKDEQDRPSQIDIWTSIMSQKNESHSSLPPYVHPLVKRSASTLSEKSLEICTESLGSETGSDVFSSFSASPSETGDEDKETEKRQSLPVDEKLPQMVDSEEIHVVKYNCAYHNKKSSGPRSFPPPLPSLSRRDGASVHMHSRRENGRLVVAAVSIPTQSNFHAQRHDGRLLLTFVNENKSSLQEVKEKDTVMDKADEDHKAVFNKVVFGETDVEEEIKKDVEEEIKKEDVKWKDGEVEDDLEEVNTKMRVKLNTPTVAASGMINVHRPKFVVNKLIRLTGRNTSIWTNKFNEVVKVELQAEEEASEQLEEPNSLTRSLTSKPQLTNLIPSTQPSMTSAMAAVAAAAASTFNAYEYCWRRKPSSATTAVFKTSHNESLPSAPTSNDSNMFILTKTGKDSSKNSNDPIMATNFLVVKGNKGDEEFIVPYFKGCKEPRRSRLFREPRCIATS